MPSLPDAGAGLLTFEKAGMSGARGPAGARRRPSRTGATDEPLQTAAVDRRTAGLRHPRRCASGGLDLSRASRRGRGAGHPAPGAGGRDTGAVLRGVQRPLQRYLPHAAGRGRAPHPRAHRGGQRLRRENAFHEEERLPPDQRARLGDYARSGFDRGHMAPSGDMATPEGQAESFSLANMVPQDLGSNRCLWERIESAVRDLALAEGEVWVLTGPIFQGEELERLNHRVLVPTSLYKAVYLPSRQVAAAYVAPNAPGTAWRAVSLAELRDLAGLDAFPTLATDVQGRAMRLPEPRPHNPRGGCGEAGTAVTADHRPTTPRGPSPGPVTPPATKSAASGRGGNLVLIVAALVAGIVCILLYRVLGRR